MWRASGHHDHVALGDLARVATIDGATADLVGSGVLSLDHATAGDEACGAIDDINQVGILRVDFGQPRLFPPAGVDHVIAPTTVVEYRALVERSIHVASLEVFHSAGRNRRRWSRRIRWRDRRCFPYEDIRAGDGEFLILLRTGCAADSDCADDLVVYDHRDPALQRSEVVERDHGSASVLDDVFEEFCRLLKKSGGTCLADGDVGAGIKSSVQALDGDQIAAIIDYGYDSAGCVDALGFRLRGGDDLLGAFKIQ